MKSQGVAYQVRASEACNMVGFPPLGYPPRHRSQDRSKPPTTHKIPLGWDAVDSRGAELLLFWPGARAT